MKLEQLGTLIRDVPDFPRPGIVFKDITPLLADAVGFAAATEELRQRVAPSRPDAIVGIESRGFIFGAALAQSMGLPLQLVRKSGKLPYRTVVQSYELEYGTDTIEMHVDAVEAGKRYAVVDDLIATGGTARATCDLIAGQGGSIAMCAFVIELSFLPGRSRLEAWPVESLLSY
jgi:adenine phosphoribosyltransferase